MGRRHLRCGREDGIPMASFLMSRSNVHCEALNVKTAMTFQPGGKWQWENAGKNDGTNEWDHFDLHFNGLKGVINPVRQPDSLYVEQK